jgi:hypothetical protein
MAGKKRLLRAHHEAGHLFGDLIGVHQFPPGPVDRIFKLIAAGFARPHVSNAVIREMLRPFRFD